MLKQKKDNLNLRKKILKYIQFLNKYWRRISPEQIKEKKKNS